MKKFTFMALLVFVSLFVFPSNNNAQFLDGKSYIGPSIGFYFDSSTPIFGANYEYGMNVKDLGLLGIGASFRYWSYGSDWFNDEISYTYIMIGGNCNYHFKLDNNKVDPFIGIGLAYINGSWDYDGPEGYGWSDPDVGGFFMGLNGGLRYFLSPNLALVARFGFGSLSYGAFDLGVDFKL
ncbi:MAG: outer membrane beta-barrel protein [bacterium]